MHVCTTQYQATTQHAIYVICMEYLVNTCIMYILHTDVCTSYYTTFWGVTCLLTSILGCVALQD